MCDLYQGVESQVPYISLPAMLLHFKIILEMAARRDFVRLLLIICVHLLLAQVVAMFSSFFNAGFLVITQLSLPSMFPGYEVAFVIYNTPPVFKTPM